MISIQEIELDLELPATEVGMVFMQPFVSLGAQEPFQWTAAARPGQLEAIARVLELARIPNHGAPKTHFTVFPEYSICGLAGIRLIQEAMAAAAWPNGTVVIGGIDALLVADIQTLAGEPETQLAFDVAGVPEGHWLNCAVTWVKDSRGIVRRWIQPKLHPAWPEKNISCDRMYEGRSVYVFKARFDNRAPCRFLSLVCFDWIGQLAGQKVLSRVLSAMNVLWDGMTNRIHWLFVLQHNPEPNHPTFLNNTAEFFNDRAQFPCVDRDHCSVIMTNTATGEAPGSSGDRGHSAVLASSLAPFDAKGCPPTYSVTNTQRKAILDRIKDAVFRENGACVHSIRQKVASYIPAGAEGRTPFLEYASVNPILAAARCPRLPGQEVPASVKWVNDTLEGIEPLGQRLPQARLAADARAQHATNATDVGQLLGVALNSRMRLASCRRECSREANPVAFPLADLWAGREREGLSHMLDVLSVVATSTGIDIASGTGHGVIRGRAVTIVAVRGDSHVDCRRYFDTIFEPPARDSVLLVTRDNDNTAPTNRDRKITEAAGAGGEPKITDAASGIRHIGFQALNDSFLAAADQNALRIQINGFLG